MDLSKFSSAVFKYRSYIPIPFLLVMLAYNNPNIWSLIIGTIIMAAGEGLRLWGVSWAGSETRTTGTVGGTFLIISGPFGYVRNPLYVGNILIYTGLGIMSFAMFPILQIAALAVFFTEYYMIVLEEEKYLAKAFGEAYSEYLKNVNRFIPGFRKFEKKDVQQPPFNLKAGLRSERRTFQAIAFVWLTIILLYIFRIMS